MPESFNFRAFGSQLYRKRYVVTVIADRTTDDGDDWGSYIGEGLGSQHCLWSLEEVESVELREATDA